MCAELSSTPVHDPAAPDASSGPEESTWRELEALLDDLGQFARTVPAPDVFYRRVVEQLMQALSAMGAAAWLRWPNGKMQLVASRGWPTPQLAADPALREAHESLLAEVVATGGTCVSAGAENPELMGAVEAAPHDGQSPGDSRPVVAVLVVAERPGSSPSVIRGHERLLAAVCEVASEYDTYRELGELRGNEQYRRELLRFSQHIHRCRRLGDLAYALANEGRALIGCDRVSVAEVRGRKCRLIAASGVRRVERRGRAARQLEQLARLACRFDEAFFYSDGSSDALPDVVDQLEEYVDASHARQLAIVPVRLAPQFSDDDPASDRAASSRSQQPLAVLIAEQFDACAGVLLNDRVMELADVSGTAFWQTVRWERLPLAGLLEMFGRTRDLLVPARFVRLIAAVGSLAAVIAALVFVQADFTVEAPGKLEPTLRRDIFAPGDALVDEVLVAHGEHVQPGQILVRLRDPQLDLELKRVTGEWQTVSQQLAAVRATRSDRTAGDTSAVDNYRLSAEEQQLKQQLVNLGRQLELLNEQREQLTIVSPLAGQVLTWEVDTLLVARPIQRGQVLLAVADLSAPWQVSIDVPDDRIGYVLAAREAFSPELPVRFRFAFDDGLPHRGHIDRVALLAEAGDLEAPAATPTVEAIVKIDEFLLDDDAQRELRPGVRVRSSILCGRRSLGYVWLHDIWDKVVEWATL